MAAWKRIRSFLSSTLRFFHISYIEAKSEHSSAHLGILWVPLSTLIFSAMLTLVFRHSDTMPIADFFLYVLAGYVLWGFIAESISGSTDVIQRRFDSAIHNNLSLAGLFGKLLIDRLFTYFLNLTLVVMLVIILAPGNIGKTLLLFPAFIVLIIMASLGAAYLVNITTIFFPDLKTMFRVATRFMFFASPVFWSAADTASGPRAFLVQYNPAAYYLSLPRQVFGIEPVEAKSWLVSATISAVMCLTGYLTYHYSQAFVRNLK